MKKILTIIMLLLIIASSSVYSENKSILDDDINSTKNLKNKIDLLTNNYATVARDYINTGNLEMLEKLKSLNTQINSLDSSALAELAKLRELYFNTIDPNEKLLNIHLASVLHEYIITLNYLRLLQTEENKQSLLNLALEHKNIGDKRFDLYFN